MLTPLPPSTAQRSGPSTSPTPLPHTPQVTDVIITRHQDTGKPKACFVEFGSQEDLKNALTLDGADMLRRPVRLQVAEPRPGGRGGGGGAWRGGGGGGGGGGVASRWGQMRAASAALRTEQGRTVG